MRPHSSGLLLIVLLVLSIPTGCYRSHETAPGSHGDEDTCQPSMDETDSFYRRFEAPDEDNSCGNHGDCLVSGCSGEICAAMGMASSCEELPTLPLGECGCADGECIWYLGDCSP